MLYFNNWLEEKAEAHERIKTISLKSETEDNGSISATEAKVSSKVFAANANAKQHIKTNAKQLRVQKMTNWQACCANVHNIPFGDVHPSKKRLLRSVLK